MLRTVIVGSAFALAAAGLGQQTGFPRPTLDTGPVHVDGSVSVTNDVGVHATQAGPWSVTVAALPPVETAPPDFVRAGHVYRLTSAGVELAVRVSDVRRGGWVRGTPLAGGKAAWYNLSQFQTVADDNEPRQ
jgi:hypothetical protein